MRKYYFSESCYWDDEKASAFRDGSEVKLSKDQTVILSYLIQNNNHQLSSAALYTRMTGLDWTLDADFKVKVSNRFTRKKTNEQGILMRLPEVEPFLQRSRADDGWYRLSIPDENIQISSQSAPDLDSYDDIWHSNKYLDMMSNRSKTDEPAWILKKFKLYLQGEACNWPILFSPKVSPVRRDIVDMLKDAVNNQLGVIALTGAGGEGKTTILMQLCVELYREGKTVLFHASSNKYDYPDNLRNCVLIVDNPPGPYEHDAREFRRFLSKAVQEGLTIVMASRSNEWNVLMNSLSDDVQRCISEIEVPKITRIEASEFARCIKENCYWVHRSLYDLETLFYKDSYGFLYASMLLAIHNTDTLEKIAKQVIERISKFDNGESLLNILAAVVFAEHCGIKVSSRYYKALCRKLSVNDRDAKYYLRKELSLNGANYQTRHESISNLFFRFLFSAEEYSSCLEDSNQEAVIIALLEYYFVDIANMTRDCNPKDPRVASIATLFTEADRVIEYDETILFLLQRLFESCKQNGHAVIDRTFHGVSNTYIKKTLAEKCFDAQLPIWEIYNYWIRNILIKEEGDIVDAHTRAKSICSFPDASPHIWLIWAKLECDSRNIGNYDVEGSAAWIYKTLSEKYSQNGHVWIAWADFANKYSSIVPAPKPADILKHACLHFESSTLVWVTWAEAEEARGNIGNYSTTGSAAWIYKETCLNKCKQSDGSPWIKWSRFAKQYHISPTPSKEECDYSRIGVLSLGCTKYNAGTSVWSEWATASLESGNIGNYSTIASTAWILKEACTKHNTSGDPVLWIRWADFAEKYLFDTTAADGDALQYSARYILRKACLEHNVKNSHLWVRWALAEEQSENIGDYDTPESAAWIYKEGCSRTLDKDGHIWIAWAAFVEQHRDEAISTDKYSPTELLKTACLELNLDSSVWQAWAAIEETQGNIGDYETKYTAAWIHMEGCMYHNPSKNFGCLLQWARFAYRYPLFDRERILITAHWVLDYARDQYPDFENSEWIELNDFMREIGYIRN